MQVGIHHGRCFQSIGVTKDWRLVLFGGWAVLALIDGFQSIGVTKDWRPVSVSGEDDKRSGFQSIGVTKDWRPKVQDKYGLPIMLRFQSIGVTKDWRRQSRSTSSRPFATFPINRRHQGLATRHGRSRTPGTDQRVSNQ